MRPFTLFMVVAAISGTNTVAPAATLHLLPDWCFRRNAFVSARARCRWRCVGVRLCVYVRPFIAIQL